MILEQSIAKRRRDSTTIFCRHGHYRFVVIFHFYILMVYVMDWRKHRRGRNPVIRVVKAFSTSCCIRRRRRRRRKQQVTFGWATHFSSLVSLLLPFEYRRCGGGIRFGLQGFDKPKPRAGRERERERAFSSESKSLRELRLHLSAVHRSFWGLADMRREKRAMLLKMAKRPRKAAAASSFKRRGEPLSDTF